MTMRRVMIVGCAGLAFAVLPIAAHTGSDGWPDLLTAEAAKGGNGGGAGGGHGGGGGNGGGGKGGQGNGAAASKGDSGGGGRAARHGSFHQLKDEGGRVNALDTGQEKLSL
jgi:hypothetical protein